MCSKHGENVTILLSSVLKNQKLKKEDAFSLKTQTLRPSKHWQKSAFCVILVKLWDSSNSSILKFRHHSILLTLL